jgi:peptidoglycan-associated lipoprotein
MKTRDLMYFVLLLSAVIAVGCAREPKSANRAVPPPPGTESSAVGSAQTATPEMPEVQTPHPENVAPRPEARDFASSPRLRDIHFDFDQYAIRPQDRQVLEANIDWFQSNPGYLILIEGHCDERGTNDYNLALGDHRAKAAANYLVAHGVQAARITMVSYGEERPLCVERTEGCWLRNRRAHFLVKAVKGER